MEYDSETGNYYDHARYYNPRLGRFMSPDPSGGHLMDPQSLNRYAYVLNDPESLIDPTGRDCVYVNKSQTTANVISGDCLKGNDGGTYVNGTVNLNSFRLTQGKNGGSLTFSFLSKAGNSTIFSEPLPRLPSPSDIFGTWAAAVQIFSRVANNPAVQMVSTPRGIATFYGTSAGLAAGGLGLATLLPRVPATAEAVQQFFFEKAVDPEVLNFLNDFIDGSTPGAVRATWGSLAGVAASEVATHWSQVSQGLQSIYQMVKASVPH